MKRVIGIILLIGAGIGAYFAVGAVVWQHRAVTQFVPVQANVISSIVGVHTGSKGRKSYSPDVTYTYQYQDSAYRSSRVLPFKETGGSGWASDIVAHFPPGQQTTAYVNPDNPQESILWRHYSVSPYMLSLVAVAVALTGVLLATGVLAGGRSKMVALPVDTDGWFLLLPVKELRKLVRDRTVMVAAYTVVALTIWGHYLLVERVSTGPIIFTIILAAVWVILAILAWRAWSASRHVSDARVTVRPVPLRPKEPFEMQVELDPYATLDVNSLRARVVCVEHYREKHGNKTTYGTRDYGERKAELCGTTRISVGEVLAGKGTICFDGHMPQSWSGRKAYPYYTWEVRVDADLAHAVDYRGVFPLEAG